MSEMGLGKAEDLTGRVFGRLTVTGFAGRDKRGQILWDCQCSCGNTVAGARSGNLRYGSTISCGCGHRESLVLRNTTHGFSGIPEWEVWRSMLARCSRPSNRDWLRYGGRGIKVCDAWALSFEAFYADMGPRPSREHSIDRRDNDGPYDRVNCFWATRVEQANNKSTNVMMTLLGETKTMALWCSEMGLSYGVVQTRRKLGWSDEDALTKPVRKRKPANRPQSCQ